MEVTADGGALITGFAEYDGRLMLPPDDLKSASPDGGGEPTLCARKAHIENP